MQVFVLERLLQSDILSQMRFGGWTADATYCHGRTFGDAETYVNQNVVIVVFFLRVNLSNL